MIFMSRLLPSSALQTQRRHQK